MIEIYHINWPNSMLSGFSIVECLQRAQTILLFVYGTCGTCLVACAFCEVTLTGSKMWNMCPNWVYWSPLASMATSTFGILTGILGKFLISKICNWDIFQNILLCRLQPLPCQIQFSKFSLSVQCKIHFSHFIWVANYPYVTKSHQPVLITYPARSGIAVPP